MPRFNVPFAVLGAALLLNKTTAAPSPSIYQLVNSYAGENFFSGWDFWDQPDPTNGFVDYTNKQTAMDSKLAGYMFNEATNETTAMMHVDHTTMNPSAGRASVRISTSQTWSHGGLFIADVRHTPQGACGSWPALWLVGPDWPHQGEIDIIEGVNDNQYNSLTLHTGPGCSSDLAPSRFLGDQITTDCDVSSGGSNTGCSIRANSSRSSPHPQQDGKTSTHPAAGPAFNAAGGGVYVTLWDATGVQIWMFPHGAVPDDVLAGRPDPTAWTAAAKPLARFGGPGCEYTTRFSAQQLVVDTTFCGDWAGRPEVWAASPACSARAPTCEEFVADHPEAFRDAYWDIASIAVYQTAEQRARSGTSVLSEKVGKRAEFPATLGEVLSEGGGSEGTGCGGGRARVLGPASGNATAPYYPMGNSTLANASTASNATANRTATVANVRRGPARLRNQKVALGDDRALRRMALARMKGFSQCLRI